MPAIVTSPWPALEAARYNTQVEFDCAHRSIQAEPEYAGKNLLFVSGLHIDISPTEGLGFPLTNFVPWAAYIRRADGTDEVFEQGDLAEILRRQPEDTPPRQVALDTEIETTNAVDEISLPPLD